MESAETQQASEQSVALADLLEARCEEIIRRWTARARRHLPTEDFPEPQLIDSLPEFLQEMFGSLRAGAPARGSAKPAGEAHIADEHGRQRFECGADLMSLIWEYGLLRDVLLDVIEEAGHVLSGAELRILTRSLDTGVAESVRRYTVEREAALSSVRSRFERLARANIVGLAVFDLRTERITEANEAFLSIVGYGPEDVTAGRLRWTDLVPPGRAQLSELALQQLRSRGATEALEGQLLRKDGSVAEVLASAALLGGSTTECIALVRDFSERKQLERERERAFEVLDRGDAFFVLDADFRFVMVNENQEKLSRKPRSQTLGRSFWEVFPEAADLQRKYWHEYHRAMRERIPVHFEEYYPPLDLWTDVSVYPTREGGIAVFFRDITEYKRQQAEVRERAEFEQQLLGIVSHDLRNPINAVLLSASSLLRREDLDGRTARIALRIHSSADRAARLIRDLLDFTQARVGGIPIHPRAVDLHALCRQVVDEVQAAHPERQIDVASSGDAEGEWDPDRLAQVLTNLLANALAYSPADGRVSVATCGEPGAVLIVVHNPGEPISQELLTRLFEPMQRGGAPTSPANRSIGLGLFIVKHVVEAHGGTVEVRSTREDGTTFTVRLPRSRH